MTSAFGWIAYPSGIDRDTSWGIPVAVISESIMVNRFDEGLPWADQLLYAKTFFGADLRRLPKASKDRAQCRRLPALAEICDGGLRTDAVRIGWVGLQIIRDWVLRLNAQGPDGLIDRKNTASRWTKRR
jgi:hypothetical protein